MTLKHVSPANVGMTLLVGTDGNPYNAGGTGGGPVTVADGADVAQGAVADAAYTSGSGSIISVLKGIFGRLLALVIAGDASAHITTATTTTVKNASGTIKKIVVNSLGTVASTVTVKDNATTLAIIDTLSTTGRTGTYDYNIACATSIVVVTTGTVAPDVTVTYQ